MADILLTDDMELGIDFVKYMSGGTWNNTLTYGTFSGLDAAGPGLTYAVTSAEKFAAQIKAAATVGRAKILTSPNLLASNNKEAKIQIGTSEPILTNTYTTTGVGTSVSPTGFVEGTIEYKDIGTILGITPRISDGGLVTLELSIEESTLTQREIGQKSTSTSVTSTATQTFSVPAFNKTTAKTVLSIKEGQTIAIGGLIRREKSNSEQGVPFLGRIPVIGFLFGKNKRTDERRELIILLTPHIITDQDQSKKVTDEFREKIQGLKKEYEKDKKE
jgi:general secretion pathway protein D